MPRPELSQLRYPNLWQGCVGAWCPSQSGATGYRLFDDSGNNNHGTLTNMDPGTDWVPSDNKLALDFDGTNDYVNASRGFRFFELSQDACTVSFWNKNSSGTTGVYVALASTTNGTPFLIFQASGASISLGHRADAGGDTSAVGGTWQSSSWRLLTGVSTPSSLTLLINGVQVATTSRTANATTLNQITLGALNRAGSLSNYAISQIDDVRIYNRALTPYEIRQLASSRGAAYERSRGRKKAYVPGYRITAPSRIQTGSARTIDGTDTESLTRGLVGAWCPSLGASGFRLIDRSGYGNHGVLTGMDPGTDWVPSGGKLALDFDGVNDGVRVESNKYSFSSGAISFWVASTTDSVRSAIAFQETTTFDNLFVVYLGDGATGVLSNELITIGSIKSAVSNIGAYTTTARSELFDGKMHHVVAMSNGTTWIIYLDGVQKTVSLGQGTNGSWMDVSNPSNLSIGCRLANSNSPNLVLNGQLDDIRIYNRVLTPSEIRLLYTGGRGVGLLPEAKPKRARIVAWDNRDKISVPARVLTNTDSLKRGLVGHWSPSLSGPQGNRLMDLSGQNNHGTLQNMNYQTDYVPSTDKGGRMALDFDGVNDYVNAGDIAVDGLSIMSISVFFRFITRSSDYVHLIGKNSTSSSRFGIGLTGTGTTNNRTNLLLTMGNGSNTFGYTTDNFVADNVWTHAVYLFDGTQSSNATRLRLFIDGNEKTLTYSGTIPTTSPTNSASLVFGAETTASFFSNSQIDDIRIYNRVLTPQEIRLLAQSRMPERATPQRTRTVFYSSGLVSYLRRRTYNSILGSGVLS